MGNIFRDILLVSDLDGTLIGDAFQIPERNQIALRRFQREGGRVCYRHRDGRWIPPPAMHI